MLAIERRNQIIEQVRSQSRVLVSELAVHYNVTEETIRRDLGKLEREGYVGSHAQWETNLRVLTFQR